MLESSDRAFDDALRRTGKIPLFHHSDQGSEYKELQHLQKVESLGIIVSMSKKASPWENGYQESFYGKFKQELGTLNRFENRGEAIAAIHLQINYYNRQRIHTSLTMPPLQFAQQFYEKAALQSTEKCV